MSAATFDPVTGIQLTDDLLRIEGAKACMWALADLVKSAEAFNRGTDESAEGYYGARFSAAKAVAAALGPLRPYQEGAIIALAEYIHLCQTTGEPDLDTWTPCVAMTADQYRDEVADLAASMEGESCLA